MGSAGIGNKANLAPEISVCKRRRRLSVSLWGCVCDGGMDLEKRSNTESSSIALQALQPGDCRNMEPFASQLLEFNFIVVHFYSFNKES